MCYFFKAMKMSQVNGIGKYKSYSGNHKLDSSSSSSNTTQLLLGFLIIIIIFIGYFTVDDKYNSNMFFWFFPAQASTREFIISESYSCFVLNAESPHYCAIVAMVAGRSWRFINVWLVCREWTINGG